VFVRKDNVTKLASFFVRFYILRGVITGAYLSRVDIFPVSYIVNGSIDGVQGGGETRNTKEKVIERDGACDMKTAVVCLSANAVGDRVKVDENQGGRPQIAGKIRRRRRGRLTRTRDAD